MKRFSASFGFSIIVGLVTLTSCGGNSQKTEAPASPAASAPATTTAPANTAQQPNAASATAGAIDFKPLNNVIASTQAAVTANDFTEANTQFAKFEGAWSKVEDGVRTKSGSNYGEIESAASQVSSALKSKDRTKSLDGLKKIQQSISAVSKS